MLPLHRLTSHFRATALTLAILWPICSAPQPLHASQPLQDARPDIVVIVADDLGWGDLSCYGATDLKSPTIDGLAARGLRWTNFYANCCVCSPTRASIMTGCYPDRVGVPGVIRTHAANSWGKLANVATLPEILSSAGYSTACIGKWHLGLEAEDHPLERGFDHFHGFLGDMMDDYYNHRRHEINYMRLDREEIDPQGHATSLFADWSVAAIQQMSQRESPYFLYLAFNAPHTPIQPPQEALLRVKMRAPSMNEKRAKLVALIEDMDSAIARVLAQVDQTGRDTVIVFTSDNGGQTDVGANNGGLRDGKQSNYEGGLRIPAIFCWANHIPENSLTSATGVTMDLLPTLCEIAHTPAPSNIDGIALNRWLTQPSESQAEREIYYVRREGGARYSGLTIEALRKGDWKLVHNLPTQPFELYNLKEDPTESQDLSRMNSGKLRELHNELMLHIQRGGQTPWQPTPPKDSPR